MEDRTMTIMELRYKMSSIFRDIIPEKVARRCQKELSKIINNGDLVKERFENKKDVDQLLEKICQMQGEPFHKIQTIVRKSTIETQLFLLERIVTLDTWLEDYDPDKLTSIPNDFAGFVREILIDDFSQKIEESIQDP